MGKMVKVPPKASPINEEIQVKLSMESLVAAHPRPRVMRSEERTAHPIFLTPTLPPKSASIPNEIRDYNSYENPFALSLTVKESMESRET
jgi:hypothetical protein